MLKKLVWLSISCLMIVSLVLASCGPAAEEEEEEEILSPEVPKYGGTLITMITTDPPNLDMALSGAGPGPAEPHYFAETLLNEDWTKGPAGTGETRSSVV